MTSRALLSIVLLTACGAPAPVPDAGSPKSDAGSSIPTVHGCTAASYVDRGAASAERKIAFGTAMGSPALGFEPACIRIAPGQVVTFVGNFNTHPLVGGANGVDAGSPNNPIGRHDTGSTDLPITFAVAGLFPYYCDLHAPTMVGVVRVE